MSREQSWSGLQLSEFLGAVTAYADEASAYNGAAERIALAMEAEIAAVVIGDRVVASVGFRPGRAPLDQLVGMARNAPPAIELPGLGQCHLTGCPIDDARDSHLLVARVDGPFTLEDRLLMQDMTRVLALAVRPLHHLEIERRMRIESEAQARDNLRLLERLKARRAFLERLIAIQRAISFREPIQKVFDEVSAAVAATLGDETVVLRVLDDEGDVRVVASVGLPEGLLDHGPDRPIGLTAQVLSAGRLIAVEDYSEVDYHRRDLVAAGIRSCMGAPVRRDGVVVGTLTVGSQARRAYREDDKRTLQAFAEQVSIALNDESAANATKAAYDEVLHIAQHDSLTGLANRRLVTTVLGEHLSVGTSTAVMFVDLDRFKAVNDSWGHEVGDEVLRQVATELTRATEPGDTVGRLSGDEFVIVYPGGRRDDALERATQVLRTLQQPRTAGGRQLVVTASIGLTMARPGDTAETLLRDADVAMYRAKQRGRGGVQVFDRGMQTELMARSETEQALRQAVGRDEFRLHYQPLVALPNGEIRGVEALLRWERPGFGLMSPGTFLDIAEETGLIVEIGAWALATACASVAAARRRPGMGHLELNVNVAAPQLVTDDFAARVRRALRDTGLPPQALAVELTESVLMDEVEAVEENLRQLRALGVRLSVDDFGTGYSSLLYLKRFHINQLKVDRRFVAGVGVTTEDTAIVAAVLGLASALGMTSVAEGVETAQQLAELERMGAPLVQGYFLGRPVPTLPGADEDALVTVAHDMR